MTKKTTLQFKEGNSDKTYEVWLEATPSGKSYKVNFAYGRTGGNLKTGTKTPRAVALEKAEEIFEKLVTEKKKKGYKAKRGKGAAKKVAKKTVKKVAKKVAKKTVKKKAAQKKATTSGKETQLVDFFIREKFIRKKDECKHMNDVIRVLYDKEEEDPDKRDLRFLWFDTEAIEESRSYEALLEKIEKTVRPALEIVNIESFGDIGGTMGVVFDLNGKNILRRWKQKDDWLTDGFFKVFNMVEKACSPTYKLVNIPMVDQNVYYFFLEKKKAVELEKTMKPLLNKDGIFEENEEEIENPDDFIGEHMTVDEAAKLVKKSGDDLYLDGLPEISDKVAEALAKFKGDVLYLDCLQTISDKAAEALVKFKGGYLGLNGLKTLSDKAAEALAKFKGPILYLDGLPEISDKVAEALAKFKGYELKLTRLKTISDKSAQALAKFKGPQKSGDQPFLYLDGLPEISDKVAEALAKFKGDALHLDGLKTLSDKAAEALAKFKGGYLGLNGLKTLSDKAVEALAKLKGGELGLNEKLKAKVEKLKY